MDRSAPLSPLREMLEGRLSKLVLELEGLYDSQLSEHVAAEVQQRLETVAAQSAAEARERARGEFADAINQAVRRMRLAPDVTELSATLADMSALFAAGAGVFRVAKSVLHGEQVRGVSSDCADAFGHLEIPLSSAA